MVRHGRQVCHARRPNCAACTLSDLCEFFLQQSGEARL